MCPLGTLRPLLQRRLPPRPPRHASHPTRSTGPAATNTRFEETYYGLSAKEFSRLFLPKHDFESLRQDGSGHLELGFGAFRFISYPVRLRLDAPDAKAAVADPAAGRPAQPKALSCFNVVFGLRRDDYDAQEARGGGAGGRAQSLAQRIRRAGRNLCLALRSEEMRCGYLTSVVARRQLRAPTATPSQAGAVGSAQTSKDHTWVDGKCAVCGRLQPPKPLVWTLDVIRTGLCSPLGMARVRLNGWMALDLTLCDLREVSPSRVRPYHTFLLSDRASAVADCLPAGASPLLHRMVRRHDPTKTFQQLAEAMDVPIGALMRLSAHLVFWQLAKITPAIHLHSRYGITPLGGVGAVLPATAGGVAAAGDKWLASSPFALRTDRKEGSRAAVPTSLVVEFERRFPKSLGLPRFLNRFNRVVELEEHKNYWMSRQGGKQNIKEMSLMLRWAVNKRLIEPHYIYVYLVLPQGAATGLPRVSSSNTLRAGVNLSAVRRRREAACLEREVGDSRQARVLRGLHWLGFLQGSVHTEEMVWRWNRGDARALPFQVPEGSLSRKDVSALLRKFKNVLVMVVRPEDPPGD